MFSQHLPGHALKSWAVGAAVRLVCKFLSQVFYPGNFPPAPRRRNLISRETPPDFLMNICMMTNTYLPHVGGVARSVSTFAEEYRKQGHGVLVVAPNFEGKPPSKRSEAIVERVAAIQKFNGSDFS